MIALSGVRRSWLMRERNSLLARLARSASLAGALQFLVGGDQFPRSLDHAGFELRIELAELAFGRRAPPPLLRFAKRALDRRAQLVEPVLEHVVGGAALQSLDGSLLANRTRHEHERHAGAVRLRQVLRLVATETGNGIVGENQVRRIGQRALEIFTRFGLDNGAVNTFRSQRPRHELPINWIVFQVDDTHPHLFDAPEVTYRRAVRKPS